MRKRRFSLSFGLALIATLSIGTLTSYAGQWIQDSNGWWYQNDDGSWTANNCQHIDGKWYHFNENGYMNVGWIQVPTTRTSGYDGHTWVENAWYYLDEQNGDMLESGRWEGGYIQSDGSLHVADVFVNHLGQVEYYEKVNEEWLSPWKTYYSEIDWKIDWMRYIDQMIGEYGEYGTYSLDYQLPANWSESCPLPLIHGAVNYELFDSWLGDEYSLCTANWTIDDNHMFHLDADYYEPSAE